MAQGSSGKRSASMNSSVPTQEEQFLARLRQGDAEAGHRFVQENYRGVYRYLLYLCGHRETAEDLAQETFLQAWRHLEQFQGRSSLPFWLHRIARREFLRARGRQRAVVSLEEVSDVAMLGAERWTDEADLRMLLEKLPEEQREVVFLHDLAGYSSTEIARIVQAPASTVRARLSAARSRLQRELGEGDLVYLNEPLAPMRQWSWLPLDQMHVLETRLGGVRCWVLGVGCSDRTDRTDRTDWMDRTEHRTPNTEHPTPNTASGATKEEPMERREFLRQAAVGAAGMMLTEPEKEVVDSRLTQKVTCAFKGTALSDLCEKLQSDTGIRVAAGPSVADEKVTLFCEKLPLREVMRQLSRPFGYTWLRTRQDLGAGSWGVGKDSRAPTPNSQPPTPVYRYELVQDVRSQLLEEELRNRDRNAALIAVDQEIQRYRPDPDLSPDEALARAKSAGEDDKKRLEALGGAGWGPIQMYFRLSPPEQAALLAGQELKFAQEPKPGEALLPADIARGVLQSQRGLRMVRETTDKGEPRLRQARPGELDGLPPSALPEARAAVTLKLDQTELGRFGFSGSSEVIINGSDWGNDTGPYAAGESHAALQPQNAALNAKFAHDPALQVKVTVTAGDRDQGSVASPGSPPQSKIQPPHPEGTRHPKSKITTADVLEALHRATGMPIVSDFFTHLYAPDTAFVKDQPLFEALNHLADALRLRWHKADGWLQFRSDSFYNDRPKEVPNRLLSRWAEARREHGHLTLDDLIEIAGLTDTQLDARDMAEGARELWGLTEWGLAGNRALRKHLRWMAGFTPAERLKVQQPPGLGFSELSLPQQQQYMALALGARADAIDSLQELATATVQIDYSLPGQFEWMPPRQASGDAPQRLAPVRAATRADALAAAHRLDAQADPTQIQPTELAITLLYSWGTSQSNGAYRLRTTGPGDTTLGTWRNKNEP